MKHLKIVVVLLTLGLVSCSSSRQGKMSQGEGGKNLKGTIIAKCTPPQKSYAKDLGIKVKSEIDSLRYVPSANFDVAFEQKVNQLKEYSPAGLDLDLLTFRICEMANNRGFTSEQTSSLIEKAIMMWSNRTGFTQNVNSYNQTGGITAGIVVVPEDKDIPLENNFIIAERTHFNRNSFELKPRQGLWFNPFIAFPISEDSTVKGTIGTANGAFMATSGVDTIIYKGKKTAMKIMSLTQSTVSIDNPYFFLYDKKPSILFFGDPNNVKKQYSMIFE